MSRSFGCHRISVLPSLMIYKRQNYNLLSSNESLVCLIFTYCCAGGWGAYLRITRKQIRYPVSGMGLFILLMYVESSMGLTLQSGDIHQSEKNFCSANVIILCLNTLWNYF